MTNKEIRAKIDFNNDKMVAILAPNTFVLNNSIARLIEENKELQKLCTHEFQNGTCIYCDMKEPKPSYD